MTNIVGPPAGQSGIKPEQWFQLLVSVMQIGGGFVAGYLVHWSTSRRDRQSREHADRREKESRRGELLATLWQWHHTIVVTDPSEAKRLYYHGGGMKELASAAVRFRSFVTDKDTFDRLSIGMSEMTPEALDANGAEHRTHTICMAIRAFADFVRSA